MTVPYSPGLEGVVAAQTEISEVDGQNGRLIYRGGYLIQEVADRSFEEIAHLLWNGELADDAQLRDFNGRLTARRALNGAARAALSGLSVDVDPMDALRTLLSAQGAAPGCPKPSLADAIAQHVEHEVAHVVPEARVDIHMDPGVESHQHAGHDH